MSGLGGPIAYLTGEYPRATDTFIQREVSALRALGAEIETFSIRRTSPDHHVGPEQKAEAAATFCVLPAARSPIGLIRRHAAAFVRSPRRYLGAMALAARTPAPGLRGALWQAFYFLEAGVLAAELSRRGVVHLHNHFGNSSCSVAMLAAAMAGLPYSYTLHGPAELFEPMSWRIGEKIARARFVACISYFARSQGMLFSNETHWSKLYVVHCGVDPARYERARVEHAAPHLLFVGRLAAIKGLTMLLEAFARVRAEQPSARLTLVGDGPDRAALEARAAALGLGDAVAFTGYRAQADVAEMLAEADIFVLPSFAEGVPVVLMEAMASRVPVVSSRVAGVAELVQDGVSGALVAPGDVDGLTERIAALLADPALRRRMGEAGRARVSAEFDVAREAERLLALFDGAARGAPPPGPRAPIAEMARRRD